MWRSYIYKLYARKVRVVRNPLRVAKLKVKMRATAAPSIPAVAYQLPRFDRETPRLRVEYYKPLLQTVLLRLYPLGNIGCKIPKMPVNRGRTVRMGNVNGLPVPAHRHVDANDLPIHHCPHRHSLLTASTNICPSMEMARPNLPERAGKSQRFRQWRAVKSLGIAALPPSAHGQQK